MTAIEHPGFAVGHDPAPVNAIGADDIRASLAEGWRDFREKRGDLVFVGLLYPLIGLVTAAFALGTATLSLLFPLYAGLSLLGPLAATGFYEIARRREAGLDAGWSHFFDVFSHPSRDAIARIGAALFGLFAAWLLAAAGIWSAFLGSAEPASIGELVRLALGTPEGLAMAAIGSLVGLGFAIAVLVTSAISLPMLLDRQVSVGTAVATSVAVARRNPATMARWGLTVATLLVIGAIPALVGLAVVLPVLGYATWHLYTRAVDRQASGGKRV